MRNKRPIEQKIAMLREDNTNATIVPAESNELFDERAFAEMEAEDVASMLVVCAVVPEIELLVELRSAHYVNFGYIFAGFN
jgi:hypothetical protein